MNRPQQVYQRILKLPCGDVREGVGLKEMLDSALKQVVSAICEPGDGFKVKVAEDSGGHLQATIMRGGHKIELQGRYGQNSIFKDGAKASFVSYTVRAESGVATLDRAENVGEGFAVIGKIAGVVLGVFLVCCFMKWMMEKARLIVYSLPLFAGIVYGGKLLGERVGRMVANAIEGEATTRILAGEDFAKAHAIWERLTNSIDSVTSSYPTV